MAPNYKFYIWSPTTKCCTSDWKEFLIDCPLVSIVLLIVISNPIDTRNELLEIHCASFILERMEYNLSYCTICYVDEAVLSTSFTSLHFIIYVGVGT